MNDHFPVLTNPWRVLVVVVSLLGPIGTAPAASPADPGATTETRNLLDNPDQRALWQDDRWSNT